MLNVEKCRANADMMAALMEAGIALMRQNLARRHPSAGDLCQLIMAARPSDLEAACDAARLIERRGFNRSRNLVDGLRAVWREFRQA